MKDKSVCNGALHPKAIEGLKLFNEKKFFEAHEELEDAWREERRRDPELVPRAYYKWRSPIYTSHAEILMARSKYMNAVPGG